MLTVSKINGHNYYFHHINNVKMVKPGHYTAMRYGILFTIEGGKYAGGRRDEWFVECKDWVKPIVCTSIGDALKMLETM